MKADKKIKAENAKLKAENAELRTLLKGNEEICRERNRLLVLNNAAQRAIKSGRKKDLDEYLRLSRKQ